MDTNKIETTLTKLRAQLATFKDDYDLPGNMSMRERDTYSATRREIDGRIRNIQSLSSELAALRPKAEDVKWRGHMVEWREILCAELLASPERPKNREEQDRQQSIKLSIIAIDRGLPDGRSLLAMRLGRLMYDTGYRVVVGPHSNVMPWFGSLPEVDRRMAEVEKRRAKLQAGLDDALLDDETRAKQEAEKTVLRNAFNTMNVRQGYGDGLVAFTPDGDELTVEEMTPLQRRAFEWMNDREKAARAERLELERPTVEVEEHAEVAE